MAEPTIVIPDAIRESDTLRDPVEQANEWLRKNLRKYTESVTASWGIGTGRKKPNLSIQDYVILELSLPSLDQPVRGVFTIEDLVDRQATESELLRLVAELMKYRGQQLLERIMEPLSQTAEVA